MQSSEADRTTSTIHRRADHPCGTGQARTVAAIATCIAACLTAGPAADAQESAPAYRLTFPAADMSVRPYHKDDPKAELTTVPAADGERAFLRIALPGQRKLEGASLSAAGLADGRLATASVTVRGKGNLWLCLFSGSGWLYSRNVVPLGDAWQTVTLGKVLRKGESTLGVHLLSRNVQPGAVFELAEVTVRLEDVVENAAAPVGLRGFSPASYRSRGDIVSDPEGGHGPVGSARYAELQWLPFPRTSLPVFVYCDLAAYKGDRVRIFTQRNGVDQFLESRVLDSGGRGWHRFGPFHFGEIVDWFGLDLLCADHPTDVSVCASVVVTTDGQASEAALDSAPGVFVQAPLVRVGRCDTAPDIDGQADDACWTQAAACTDFRLVATELPPEADTVVRFTYDDTNLYVLAECFEPVLDVRRQQTHEFRAELTQRDSQVYRDSALMLLIDSAGDGETLYDIMVNAKGTVADAVCTAPDYWTSRDLSWNADIGAAGHVGDGVWRVELAIPLAALQAQTPVPGSTWQFACGRVARKRGETSSWNASGAGFHAPKAFGTLSFGDVPGGFLLDAGARPVLGRNEFTLTTAAEAAQTENADLLVVTSIYADTPTHSYAHVTPTDRKTDHDLAYRVTHEGEVDIRQGILAAATLEPLYLKAPVTETVKSTMAELHFACSGAYEIWIADERIAAGTDRRAGTPVPCPLAKGRNSVRIWCDGSVTAARLQPPGQSADAPTVWKMTSAAAEEAAKVTVDDSEWESAAVSAERPAGSEGGILLRHTLLWETTRLWPPPEPAWTLVPDVAQQLTFVLDHPRSRVLREWSLYLGVPAGFEVLGATGYYAAGRDFQARHSVSELGERSIDGQSFRLVRIVADKPVRWQSHHIFRVLNVFVRRPASAGALSSDARFMYWTEAEEGAYTEARQSFAVSLLPPLRGRQPRELVWQLWGSFFGAMDSEAMKEELLRTAQAAGFNDLVAGDAWTSENGPRYGISNTKGIRFVSWSIDLKPFLEAHPDFSLVDSAGNTSSEFMCTTRMLGAGWPAVQEQLARLIEESRAQTLDYDFEYSPFSGPHSCFCPRCLDAFREQAGTIAEDKELTPASIKADHAEAWIDFMARRVASVFLRMKEGIHAVDAAVEFSTYSGYQTPTNPLQYGVNWHYVGDMQACDRAGCGYGRPVPAITETLEALRGIPVCYGILVRPYSTDELVPLRPVTTAEVLRRSLDASGGVLVYDRLPLDGRCWLAVAEASRLVATFEDVFLAGDRLPCGAQPESQVTVLRGAGKQLLFVLNTGSSERTYTFAVPFSGAEFYTGATASAGEMVSLRLAEGDARVFVSTAP